MGYHFKYLNPMINVTVIGFGNVGAMLSTLLLNNIHPLRLNVMEPDDQKEGALLDLAHSMQLYHNKELKVNNEALFRNADFIFLSAGVPNEQSSSRLSTAKENIQLSKDIFKSKSITKNPYAIIISNPVDITSHAVYQYSGLPAERVIGIGTFLDSIRLSHYLSSLSNFQALDFESWVLGEHGSTQVPIYSKCKLMGKPLLDFSEFSPEKLKVAKEKTKNAAFQIRETQKGTKYGVAKCAAMLFDYLLGEEEHQLSLSMLTNQHYRSLLQLDHDIYISLPVKIKNGKVSLSNELNLSEQELKALRQSAKLLSEYVER
jgi:L-lactate dehydrogenase